jgi:hypothetical protein
MNRQIAALATVVALASCNAEPAAKKYTLLEVINLKGMCREDHANSGGEYIGHVVRYRAEDTGEILAYGSVTIVDPATNAIRSAQSPTTYQPPFMVSFDDIGVDTAQGHWTLHGISDSRRDDDLKRGYATTCELDVVSRDHDLSSIDPASSSH